MDGNLRKEHSREILMQHLKTITKKLKLGHNDSYKWMLTLTIPSKLDVKCLNDSKVIVLQWPSQYPNLSARDLVWAQPKRCVSVLQLVNLTQLPHSVSRNGI